MEEFGGTGQLVQLGPAHLPIGSRAEGGIAKQTIVSIAKRLPLCLLSHGKLICKFAMINYYHTCRAFKSLFTFKI